MDIKLHKLTSTAPKSQTTPSSIMDDELVRQYGVSTATIRCWRYSDGVYDRPHTRYNLLGTSLYRYFSVAEV